jgi:hypothetical protein
MILSFLLEAFEALRVGGASGGAGDLHVLADYLDEQEHPEREAVRGVVHAPYPPLTGRMSSGWPLMAGGWWCLLFRPPDAGDALATLRLEVDRSAPGAEAVGRTLGPCQRLVRYSDGQPEPFDTHTAAEWLRLSLTAAILGMSTFELTVRWSLRYGEDDQVASCLLLEDVPRDAVDRLRGEDPERYGRAVAEIERLPSLMFHDEVDWTRRWVLYDWAMM